MRSFLAIGFGVAAVIGGIYLYKKYGHGKEKKILGRAAAIVLGDKVGTVTGYQLAGPAGAIVGGVAGAVGGVIVANKYLGSRI